MLESRDDFSVWEFHSMTLLCRGLGIKHLPMASEDISTFGSEGWRDEVTPEQREVWEYVAPRYLTTRIRKHPFQQALETDSEFAEEHVQAEIEAFREARADEDRSFLLNMTASPNNHERSLVRLSDSLADISDAEIEERNSLRPTRALRDNRDNVINSSSIATERPTTPASQRRVQLQGPIHFEQSIGQLSFRHRTFNPTVAHPFIRATNANVEAQQTLRNTG